MFYLTDLNAESFGHAAQQLKSIDDSHDFFLRLIIRVVANYGRLHVKINIMHTRTQKTCSIIAT